VVLLGRYLDVEITLVHGSRMVMCGQVLSAVIQPRRLTANPVVPACLPANLVVRGDALGVLGGRTDRGRSCGAVRRAVVRGCCTRVSAASVAGLRDGAVRGRGAGAAVSLAARRSLAAAVLRPTAKAADASALLARSITPEMMRPDCSDTLRMSRPVVPVSVARHLPDHPAPLPMRVRPRPAEPVGSHIDRPARANHLKPKDLRTHLCEPPQHRGRPPADAPHGRAAGDANAAGHN
jgi:hypothetical protein